MKRTINYYLAFAAVIMLFASSCKKEKTPEVYFSKSSATVDKEGTDIVSIEISEPTNNVIELNFEAAGTNPIKFGSYEGVFIRDDSEKMEAKIDPYAFIDTLGHMKIIPGTKKVTITFKHKDDDFPHAPSSYTIKMVSGINAKIRSGQDSYTYSINQSDQRTHFTSVLTYTGAGGSSIGTYNLLSHTYTKNGDNYDLTLNYAVASDPAPTSGISGISITYPNLPPFALGPNMFDCNTTSVSVLLDQNPSDVCSNGATSMMNLPIDYSKNPSPAYGDFFVSDSGAINIVTGNYTLKGSLKCQFVVY